MNKKWILHFFVGSVVMIGTPSYAGLIAGDLLASGHVNRLEYKNVWQSGFTSPNDQFAVVKTADVQRLPDSLVDDSAHLYKDSQGILVADDWPSQQRFFVVSDTKNADVSSKVEASWLFDLPDAEDLTLSIDVAAMGDFEASDLFSLELSDFSMGWRQLFDFEVLGNTSQSYRLTSGKEVILNDPLSLNDRVLSNEFSRFQWSLPKIDRLGVKLTARADGGQEAFAMTNMRVTGQAIKVSEPGPVWLMLLGLTLLCTSKVNQSV